MTISETNKMLLVGDNPFHGISHLSEDRIRVRGDNPRNVEFAAQLVLTSVDNGANGFMFSVSDTTLSILQLVSKKVESHQLTLHAIVPYAYEYVRSATRLGTMGLAKKLARRMIMSGNLTSIRHGLMGIVGMNPNELMKTYLTYEISRVKSSIGKRHSLTSVLLHEVITDMIIALDLDWLAKSYISFLSSLQIKPGFETRNFAYLVHKFKQWGIDFDGIEIVTSFNKVGFQMNPSKIECEKALEEIPECDIIAMSILAAGYIRLPEAAGYIEKLPNLRGVVVGVSKEYHARETFRFLKSI